MQHFDRLSSVAIDFGDFPEFQAWRGHLFIILEDARRASRIGRSTLLQKTICSENVFWYSEIALALKSPRKNYGYSR